jgi:4-hydroxybenzoyl-CoA thioesterase
MPQHSMTLRVNWGDCDPASIVFYPQYFRWFDQATAEFFAAIGLEQTELFARLDLLGFPILDAGARFTRPARFRELLRIDTRVSELKRSTFRLEHRIYCGDTLAVRGHELRACVIEDKSHPNGIRAVPLPDVILEKLRD